MLDRLKGDATQWLKDWQTESLRQRPRPNAQRFDGAKSSGKTPTVRSSPAKIVAAIIMTGSFLFAGQHASAETVASLDDKPQKEVARVELSDLQQQTLFAEASKCYNTALEKVESDSAEAKQGFADAADKYQLLVSGGVANSRLYFNLGNAYLESGQTGRAVANYLRCLRIEPTMHEAQLNLAYAKKMLKLPAGAADAKAAEQTFATYALIGNEWLSSRISPHAMFVLMIGAWITVWAFIGARVLGYRFPWKRATIAAIVVFVLSAASTMLSWQTAERQVAVVVQSPAAVGAKVDVAASRVSPGEVVEPIQTRGGSIRVRTENGETIWLPSDSVEVI
jgi:TolA-binding protein